MTEIAPVYKVLAVVQVESKAEVAHLEDNNVEGANSKWLLSREEANRAEEFDRNLTFWQACKIYKAVSVQCTPYPDSILTRQAAFWAFIASLSVVMEGFDTSFTGSVIAEGTFQNVRFIILHECER
jgi:hypothetical protein